MELTEKILDLARKYASTTSANLSELIQYQSLSMKEASMQQVLIRQMREAGLENAALDGLGNAIGSLGKGSRILAFDGHVDTVDTGNAANWSFPPFSGEIKEGYVWGRGTVDQKGGVAAFVTAARILKDLGFDRDLQVYFIGSVMEEDCDGLCWKYIVEEGKIRPDWVVITEPTNLNIYRGHRGRMEMHLTFNGLSAHGSAPERGINAIYLASNAALEIEKLNERLPSDAFLGKGSITISEIISGSPSLCAVADYARLHLDRRLTRGETREIALSEVTSIAEKYQGKASLLYYQDKAFTGLNFGMEKYFPTWILEENHPLIAHGKDAYQQLFGKNPVTDKWTFSTNGVVINGIYGIPCLGFGPGNEVMAHAPDEKVKIDDLVTASAYYAWLAMTL